MSFSFFKKPHLEGIPRDLVLLAVINGLSDMALNGAAIFGTLAVLSGSYFIHGLSGLGIYIAVSALSTFIGYVGVCRFGAVLGLKLRTALYAVFIIHSIGFAVAALVHPAFLALSDGLGLGIFYAVFMLKNINEIRDHARDRYATLMGLIQQSTTMIAPFLGTAMLYVGVHMGVASPFLPAFLAFALCVLIALPVIRHIPNAPLPYSVVLPVKAVAERRHAPAMGLIFSATFCQRLVNPLVIISSFALLGKVVKVGWFATLITVLAAVSLILSHYVRLPGRRWQILSGSLIGIGLIFSLFDVTFNFETLLLAGVVFALLEVNFGAAWFALGTRTLEHEWGHFGKNQALVLGEIFVLGARLAAAALFLIGGLCGLNLRQGLILLTALYLLSALLASNLARLLDRRYKAAG